MLRFTLDTSGVIHGAQGQDHGLEIEELADLARDGQVRLWITTAFVMDQERAGVDKRERNLAWLSERPVIGTVAGPFRLNYSGLAMGHIIATEEQKVVAMTVDEILLPEQYRVGNLKSDDEAQMAKWHRKAGDPHHLMAHFMAGHDAFVTDDDGILKKRDALREQTRIVVIDPPTAVQMVRAAKPR
jgi:hypothetical protein